LLLCNIALKFVVDMSSGYAATASALDAGRIEVNQGHGQGHGHTISS